MPDTDPVSIGGLSPNPSSSMFARTVMGAGWVVGWRMATRILGLLSTVLLVRLLSPGDFGLVALATGFVVAVDTLSSLGVEDTLVRETSPTAAMYDTAFTMNVLRGVMTGALLAGGAVPLARFFEEPRLTNVVWALAVGALLAGVGNIGLVDFRRQMRFEMELVQQLLPRLLSIAVTLAVAFVWHSYWALVAGLLANRTLTLMLGYRLHPMRPRLGLSAWRHLVSFSAWSWAVCMVGLVRDRLDAFALGRLMDTRAVGIYAIGEEVAALPTTELVAPLGRSAFSAFAATRTEAPRSGQVFLELTAAGFLLTFPAGIGISAVAAPLIHVAVGANWVAAIPVIQTLGILGAVSIFGVCGQTFLTANALLGRQFGIMLAGVVLRLALILPLIDRFGILGAAVGTLASTVVEHCLFVSIVLRIGRIRVASLLIQTWRALAAGLLMASVLAVTGLGWTGSSPGAALQGLLAASVVGVLVYIGTLGVLWLVSGRPKSAEARFVAMVVRLLRVVVIAVQGIGNGRNVVRSRLRFGSPDNGDAR